MCVYICTEFLKFPGASIFQTFLFLLHVLQRRWYNNYTTSVNLPPSVSFFNFLLTRVTSPMVGTVPRCNLRTSGEYTPAGFYSPVCHEFIARFNVEDRYEETLVFLFSLLFFSFFPSSSFSPHEPFSSLFDNAGSPRYRIVPSRSNDSRGQYTLDVQISTLSFQSAARRNVPTSSAFFLRPVIFFWSFIEMAGQVNFVLSASEKLLIF